MIQFFRIFVSVVFVMTLYPLQAQEYLGGLTQNQTVTENSRLKSEHSGQSAAFLTLPFFDNFRSTAGAPDAQKWLGTSVFVNNGFGYLPPDRGVATLDALDSTGQLYAQASSASFRADELLSKPIRLDSIWNPLPEKCSPADSLYLSFYYQPQGYGLAPEENDSLVLAFRVLDGDSSLNATSGKWEKTTVWKTVWKTTGTSLKAFQEKYGKDFVRVMIPLRDSAFFHAGFQFRFLNYASIANEINPSWKANDDEWNIDLVYLNRGRSAADTTFAALAFSGESPVFLKHYTAMPYRQYRADPTNALRTDFHLFFSNLDRVDHTVHYQYEVNERGGAFSYGYNGGDCLLAPFYQVGFQSCNTSCGAAQACPPVNSLFSLNYDRDTASYRMVHFISDSSQSPALVDSMVRIQPFYNYYSYDDGTPELAYGVASSGSEVAYRFKLNVPDTLQSVEIYFNHSPFETTPYFNLCVWLDNNGKPGQLIYQKTNVPVKAPSGMNRFTRYDLDEPLLVSGTIYVGYQQLSQNLTVGFDANDDAGEAIFYAVNNQWYSSQFHGALLMRPVFGKPLMTAIQDKKQSSILPLSVFPNPAHNEIYLSTIQINPSHPAQIDVFDLFGRKVLEQKLVKNSLKLEKLEAGIYLMRIRYNHQLYSTKFLIRK